MARLHDVVVDCAHPASLARFWAAVLDGYDVAPYDDAELARLRAVGITDVADDPTVLVQPALPGPRLWFQRVPGGRGTGRNPLHLDVLAPDVDAEARRLRDLGARVRSRHADHLVMADPEGNLFCVYAG